MLFSFVPGKLVPVPPLTDIFCFAPRNQAPSRSMLVWHFRRADTADPVKGLSEGIWRSQNKHWTWPRSQVPHDTLHICTLLESTLWWCCFHIHQWNGQGTETPKHFNCCTGHRPRTEFSNSGVADDMDNVGPVSLDFQVSCSLWGSDNKSQSQKARTSCTYLRQLTTSHKVWNSLHFGCLYFVLDAELNHHADLGNERWIHYYM